MDIKESKKEIQVSAELPGLDVKDIEINVTDDVLTLRSHKCQESKNEGENYYHTERSYGAFQRSIPFPGNVHTDNVKAEFKNGILKITMPREPEAQQKAKKIEIKSS